MTYQGDLKRKVAGYYGLSWRQVDLPYPQWAALRDRYLREVGRANPRRRSRRNSKYEVRFGLKRGGERWTSGPYRSHKSAKKRIRKYKTGWRRAPLSAEILRYGHDFNPRRRSRRNPYYVVHKKSNRVRSDSCKTRKRALEHARYMERTDYGKHDVRYSKYGMGMDVKFRKNPRRRARRNPSVPKFSSLITRLRKSRIVPASKADRIIARMQNGATITDAFYAEFGRGYEAKLKAFVRAYPTALKWNPRRRSRKNPWFVGKKRGRSYVWRARKSPRKVKRTYRVGGHRFARVCKYKTRRGAMRKARGTVWTRARRNPRYRKNPYGLLAAASVGPLVSWWANALSSKRKGKRRRTYRRNPGLACPPVRPGGKIPVERFERWLEKNGTAKDKSDFRKAMKKYTDVHLGTKPKYVGSEIMNFDNDKTITKRVYLASMGKAPTSTYITPKRSGKSDNGKSTAYEHEWGEAGGRMPNVLVDASGRHLILPLRGKSRVAKGWMRG
jgi:hypothetical protein